MLTLPELQSLKTLSYPLMVIAQLDGPVGDTILAEACQVNRSTAHRWLVRLAALGYLTRQRSHNGYGLTIQARSALRQSETGLNPNENDANSTRTGAGPTTRESSPDNHHLAEQRMPNPSRDGNSSTFVAKRNLSVPFSTSPATAATESISENNLKNLKAEADNLDQDCNSALLRVLRECGIGEPKRSQLCRLPWITPALIQVWRDHLHSRKRLSTGLLIHCLETGEPPPEIEPHREGFGMLAALLSDTDLDTEQDDEVWRARIEAEYPLWRQKPGE